MDLNGLDIGDEPAILRATDGSFRTGPGGETVISAISLAGTITFGFFMAAPRRRSRRVRFALSRPLFGSRAQIQGQLNLRHEHEHEHGAGVPVPPPWITATDDDHLAGVVGRDHRRRHRPRPRPHPPRPRPEPHTATLAATAHRTEKTPTASLFIER